MPLAPSGEAVVLTALLASRYISMHTGNPTGGNEVVGGSYARVDAGTWTQSGSDPTVASNDNDLTFPTASGSWGTLSWFGIWDASSGGNLIAYDELDVAKAIDTGDVARFPAGSLDVEAT